MHQKKKSLAIILLSAVALALILVAVVNSTGNTALAQQRRRLPVPDIDKYSSHWSEYEPIVSEGPYQEWSILRRLNGAHPLRPAKKGSVLTDLNAVNYAVLEPSGVIVRQALVSCQRIMYVVSGEGNVQTTDKTVELYDGIGVLMPPGMPYTLKNTGKSPLSMYIVEEPIPDGFSPRKDMAVRYEYDNNISTNVNRVDSDNWLFGPHDGLSTLVSFNPIMYEPKSLVPPHVHEPGIEEVWIAVRGDMQIMVGRQRRDFPPGSAYKVPADGYTPHTNINITDTSKKLLWMMKVPVVRVPVPQQERGRNGII